MGPDLPSVSETKLDTGIGGESGCDNSKPSLRLHLACVTLHARNITYSASAVSLCSAATK